jgi:hypothetical protein
LELIGGRLFSFVHHGLSSFSDFKRTVVAV